MKFIKPIVLILLSFILVSCEPKNNEETSFSPKEIEELVLSFLNEGQQLKAENILEKYAPLYNDNQKITFLKAALIRSRFWVEKSYPHFKKVVELAPNTIVGQASLHILYLDARKEYEKHFSDLQIMVSKNPNNIMLRWMLAVQCRAFNQNEIGIKHYKIILDKWNPGPVLVHQTYANMLDALSRYEESLVHRKKAVELDPQGFTYQGFGNTLAMLNKFDEANAAFKKSVEISSDLSEAWRAWAWSLGREGKYDQAIEKVQKAIELDTFNSQAWIVWGGCLEAQGKRRQALAKYKKALESNPFDRRLEYLVTKLEQELNKKHLR